MTYEDALGPLIARLAMMKGGGRGRPPHLDHLERLAALRGSRGGPPFGGPLFGGPFGGGPFGGGRGRRRRGRWRRKATSARSRRRLRRWPRRAGRCTGSSPRTATPTTPTPTPTRLSGTPDP